MFKVNLKSGVDVLFTKTQQKILALLFGRPDDTFYMNQIVRMADMGKGTIKRELEKMQTSGLLTVERIGNQNHYQANRDCPIYEELLAIVRKTFGVVGVIKEMLLPLTDQIDMVFIYGSIARGEETADSDVDLLVVSNSLAYAELMNVLADAERILGRPVNPSIYAMKDIKKKLHDKNAFLTKVMERPKLWVKGSEDDIREIGQSGKNQEIEN